MLKEKDDYFKLRQWRLNVVEQSLRIPYDLLGTFWSSEVGKKVLQLSNSDLLYEDLNEDEEKIVDSLKYICLRESSIEKLFPGWVAIQLFLFSHQVNTILRTSEILMSVPAGLLELCVCLLFRRPRMMLEIGETDRYSEFLEKLTTDLKKLVLNESFSERVLLAGAFLNNFCALPLYFSRSNMRNIMVQRAAILEFFIQYGNCREALDCQCSGSGVDESRLRVGFFIPQLYPRAETYVTLPLLKELNREHFSLHIFTFGKCLEEFRVYFESMVDGLIFLPLNVEDCVEAIRLRRMDMLVFSTNLVVGAGFSELLAAYRLAPVQIVETCCPVTTGLKNIDYYLSGSFTEPPNADEFYSEELVMVEGPAQAYCIFPEKTEVSYKKKWNRAALGISEDATVFISGANANKIIPELRLLWARILAAVPGSYMVLYPFNKNWQAEYPVSGFIRSLLQFGEQCGVDGKRWKVLPEPFESREELLSMIGNADVYLDSMRHSGAVSMLDPLLLNLPPVVIDGAYGRGRQAAAIMRSLGLDDYICQTEADYFALAVELGKQKSRRLLFAEQIRERMAENPQIFDCRRYAGEVGRILMQIAGNHSLLKQKKIFTGNRGCVGTRSAF